MVRATDLLTQFLDCRDSEESDRLLDLLVRDQAAPIVKRIVSFKIRGAMGEDVRSDVLVGLIAHLRELKNSDTRGTIRDFSSYSAVAAYHGCDRHFRLCFPQRYRLENRLRYLLGKHRRLALWIAQDGEWICGNEKWRQHQPEVKAPRRPSLWASSREAVRLVETILDDCRAPIPFQDLIELVAKHWRISDQPEPPSYDHAREVASVETDLARREWLRHLWGEIGELPLLQRISLLLNMRDEGGEGALTLLPITGVASLAQIAAILEMSVEDLTRIWNDLPLDDLRIAERLGLNRQGVINLRRSARERLNSH
jgi:hypothetical protein